MVFSFVLREKSLTLQSLTNRIEAMNIKQRIKEAGMTISEVAAKMPRPDGGTGIAQPSLSAIINGNPTINRLIDIANIIGISLSELVAEDNATDNTTPHCPHCGKPITVKTIIE